MALDEQHEEQFPSLRDAESDVQRPQRRKENTTFEDRIAAWKKLVNESEGKVLRLSDFNKAASTTTAAYHIRLLVDKGVLVRHRVDTGVSGKFYTYSWDEQKEEQLSDITKKRPWEHVIEREQSLNSLTFDDLEDYAQEFTMKTSQEAKEETAALKNLGVTQFLKHVKENMADPLGKKV
jgi:predicted transcriptional regulator